MMDNLIVKQLIKNSFDIPLQVTYPNGKTEVYNGENPRVKIKFNKKISVATVVKTLRKKEEKAVARTGSPDLNMLFVLNMPPRAMAKMTGGMISPDMVNRGIMDIPNKHFWKGLGHMISGYFRNQSDNKKTLKEIEQ